MVPMRDDEDPCPGRLPERDADLVGCLGRPTDDDQVVEPEAGKAAYRAGAASLDSVDVEIQARERSGCLGLVR